MKNNKKMSSLFIVCALFSSASFAVCTPVHNIYGSQIGFGHPYPVTWTATQVTNAGIQSCRDYGFSLPTEAPEAQLTTCLVSLTTDGASYKYNGVMSRSYYGICGKEVRRIVPGLNKKQDIFTMQPSLESDQPVIVCPNGAC
jgi:hypothetical protein